MFDLEGSIVTAIQIIALILLTIGVYPYRIRTKNRNLIIHGFLAIIALALNISTIFYVMIPTLIDGIGLLNELSVLQSAIVWLHVGIGLLAVILGVVIVVSWIIHPLAELGCSRTWRLMIPAFAFWTFALILGILINYYEIL